MSTKIYNGCKMNLLTIEEFDEFLMDVRKIVNPILKEKYLYLLLNSATNTAMDLSRMNSKGISLDNYLMDLYKSIKGTLSDIDTIHEYFRKKSGYSSLIEIAEKSVEAKILDAHVYSKNNSFNFDVDFAFKPIQDKMLCIVYNDNILEKMLKSEELKKYGFTQYYYFNNTDHPEDISDEEWEERKNDWENIGYIPAQSCICINLGYSSAFDIPNIYIDYDNYNIEEEFSKIKKKALQVEINDATFGLFCEMENLDTHSYMKNLCLYNEAKEKGELKKLYTGVEKTINDMMEWYTYHALHGPILEVMESLHLQ